MGSTEIVVTDTDILIDHLRGFAKAKIFLNLFYENSLSGLISTITVMELLSGKSASEEVRRIKIERLFSLLQSENIEKRDGSNFAAKILKNCLMKMSSLI